MVVRKIGQFEKSGVNLQMILRRGSDFWSGGEVFPYMGYIGMCGHKGCGFSAVLVINRVSILAILVINRVWFLHSGLELGMFLTRSYFFIIINNTIKKSPSAATDINRLSNFWSVHTPTQLFWKYTSPPPGYREV